MRKLLKIMLLAPLVAGHSAELRVPSIFSDHMVFQCGQSVPVWGGADAGEMITVDASLKYFSRFPPHFLKFEP